MALRSPGGFDRRAVAGRRGVLASSLRSGRDVGFAARARSPAGTVPKRFAMRRRVHARRKVQREAARGSSSPTLTCPSRRRFKLFETFFQASRSYHGRNLPPRKSTPSVSIASAWGVSFNLVVPGSTFLGQEKVPCSSRLVSTHNPVPSQHKILIRVCRRC